MIPQTVRILGTDSPLAGATIDTGANATVYSQKISMGYSPTWAVHMEWTGTPTSAVTIWASCKPSPNEATDADWVQDTGVTFTGPAGSASKLLQELGNSGAKWYRFKIVTTVSSGTISGWVHGKASK